MSWETLPSHRKDCCREIYEKQILMSKECPSIFHVNRKLRKKKVWCGFKKYTSNWDHSSGRIVKQNSFKSFREIYKMWTKAEVRTSRHNDASRRQAAAAALLVLSHSWIKGFRSILPGERRTGLVLRGLKSPFQIKVCFAFHFEFKMPESEWRVEGCSIQIDEVQCEVSTVSDV